MQALPAMTGTEGHWEIALTRPGGAGVPFISLPYVLPLLRSARRAVSSAKVFVAKKVPERKCVERRQREGGPDCHVAPGGGSSQ